MGWNRITTGVGKDRNSDLAALQLLLDGHGADRTRWPARERLRFATLIADDRDAQRLLREAEVLDRLIDMSPRVRPAREAELAARIVAAAMAEPRRGDAAGVRPASVAVVAGGSGRPMIAMRRLLPAAGLLAASLLVGVIVGGAGLMSPALQSIAAAVGVSSDSDSPQLAQLGDLGFEEDQL